MSETNEPKYPRLKLQEINLAASQFFDAASALPKGDPQIRALRQKGHETLLSGAEAYVQENNLQAERLDELLTSELVFLFCTLHKSALPELENKELLVAIDDECMERLCQANDNNWIVNSKERNALLKYCRNAPNILNPNTNYYADTVKYCRDSIVNLEANRFASPQKEKKEKKEKTVEIKPQPTVVNEKKPVAKPLAPIREKNYGADVINEFKKVAPAYGIRVKRAEEKTDDFVRYDLYTWKKREDDKPTGSLSIHSDKQVTLDSQEYEHFVATLKALKAAGNSQVNLGKLSSNPEEAKKFAANMVVAAQIVDIKVEQPFKLEELQKHHPKIENILKIQAQQKQPAPAKQQTVR